MSDGDHLASLTGTLSGTDKDELIARLWRDLQAERLRSNELERRLDAGDKAAPLLARLQEVPARPRISRPRSRGWSRRLVFARSRSLVVIAGVVACAFALDFAIGKVQQHRLDEKRRDEVQLRHAAFQGMFVEVANVAYEADRKSYRLTVRFTNTGSPVHVMLSPVRAFQQSGLSWVEIPSRDASGETVRVVKLAGSYTVDTIFEPNLLEWTELIPGYMHMRFQTESLISRRAEPDDDVIERTDRHYMYLKPHGADDDAIRSRLKIRGDPPVYMPMPPH